MVAKRLKSIGVVLMVVFLLGSGAAHAVAAEFHSDTSSTGIEATQLNTHVFKSTAGEVTCASALYKGIAIFKTFSSVTLSPFWSECHITALGKVAGTTTGNGCSYTFYAGGTVDINCPAGKQIEFNAAGCHITIPAQTGLKAVSYSTVGSHIDISMSLSEVRYNHSGFLCGTGGGTNGTQTGALTAEGNSKLWYA